MGPRMWRSCHRRGICAAGCGPGGDHRGHPAAAGPGLPGERGYLEAAKLEPRYSLSPPERSGRTPRRRRVPEGEAAQGRHDQPDRVHRRQGSSPGFAIEGDRRQPRRQPGLDHEQQQTGNSNTGNSNTSTSSRTGAGASTTNGGITGGVSGGQSGDVRSSDSTRNGTTDSRHAEQGTSSRNGSDQPTSSRSSSNSVIPSGQEIDVRLRERALVVNRPGRAALRGRRRLRICFRETRS